MRRLTAWVCLALGGCASVRVTKDAAGRQDAPLLARPPRAVLLPARTRADGTATASRLLWLPDARSPIELGLAPGLGRARLAYSLREDDEFVGYLTRLEAEADGRAAASADALGRLAAATWTGAVAAGAAGR